MVHARWRDLKEKSRVKRLGVCVCVSLGAFLVRYVARVMSAKVHETAEISSLPGEERIHAA